MITKPLRGATVAVQGYGNAGAIAARLLHDDGARVVAVSDSQGGLYSSRGPRPRGRWRSTRRRTGSVVGFKGAERITNEELLEVKCDVLVPAALENQITLRNAVPRAGADRGRGGQRAHHARGRPRPARPRGVRDPRHPLQRGRA